jgi:hypothetical protein
MISFSLHVSHPLAATTPQSTSSLVGWSVNGNRIYFMKSVVRCIRVCFSVCGILCMSQYTVTEPSRVYVRRVCAVPLLIRVRDFLRCGHRDRHVVPAFFIHTVQPIIHR